jgi:addiction module RelE/StbE family toxin
VLLVDWSDEAQLDLAEIQFYIEQFNHIAAHDIRQIIEQSAERLAFMPFAFRHGRVSGTREYVVHQNYILVYKVGSASIEILRVLHSRQQYP